MSEFRSGSLLVGRINVNIGPLDRILAGKLEIKGFGRGNNRERSSSRNRSEGEVGGALQQKFYSKGKGEHEFEFEGRVASLSNLSKCDSNVSRRNSTGRGLR